jgi:gliding motility-associated-like protein
LLSCTKDTTVFLPLIPDECIDIPNSFTPNGDGVNDTWQLGNLEHFPDCVMKIFNKLGRLLYESPKGYTEWWDGTYNGNPVPSGTYYYVLDLGNGRNGKMGAVTIVR